MSLAALNDIPADQEAWDAWAFNHAVIHYDIVGAVRAQKNVTGLQQFLLYPIDQSNFGLWLYYHQTAHNQANLALGTSGYNLLQLDLKDPDSVQAWIELNLDEHQRFNAALGVD